MPVAALVVMADLVRLGCLACHSINGRGGSVGPDLTSIGILRTPASLRLAIENPSAEVHRDYLTVVATTVDGRRVEGVALNEDDLSIQLRQADGTPRSLLKRNLTELRRENRSLMPSFAGRMTPSELYALVAYLASLRGRPSGVAVPRAREVARTSENLAWMRRPGRDRDERPEMLLDALGIKRGSNVVDLGAGAGYFTWRLAARVGPAGRVVAIDVQQSMLDLISEDLTRRGIRNVDLRLGTGREPGIAIGTADLVLVANAYHEFAEPEAMMAAVRRSLAPGGRVVVVEYAKEEVGVAMAPAHKMALGDILAEMEASGFELEQVLDFLPMQHGLVFRSAK